MKNILFGLLLIIIPQLELLKAQDCDCVYPIVFVHGWAGNEKSWGDFAKELEVWGDSIIIPTYENGAYSPGTVYYAHLNFQYGETNIWGANNMPDYPNGQSMPLYNDDDVVVHEQFANAPPLLRNKCVYAISFQVKKDPIFSIPVLITERHPFFDKDSGTAETPDGESDSNEASAFKQGYAIGKAIAKILEATEKEKVVLVGHSMGGVAIREYLQRKIENENLWWVYPDELLSGHRVAKVLTVGTPHRGSNTGNRNVSWADDVLSLFNLGDFDLKSEAIRDLRYSYEVGGVASSGVFLFGGNEEEILTDNLEDYYNLDVNCNGSENDPIIGINISGTDPWNGTHHNPNLNLPLNVKYTYYVSDIEEPFPFLNALNNSDGIVLANRQWLYDGGDGSTNNFIAGVSISRPYLQASNFLSDRITTPKVAYHVSDLAKIRTTISETNDYNNVIRGLDEADFPYFAGTVKPFKKYAGLIQKRADIVAEHSNPLIPGVSVTNDNTVDADWYKLEITAENAYFYKLFVTKPTGHYFKVDFFKNSTPESFQNPDPSDPLFSMVSEEEELMIMDLDFLHPGEYYFRITSKYNGDPSSWRTPYSFQITEPTNCEARLKYSDKTVEINTTLIEGEHVLQDLIRNIVTYDARNTSASINLANFSDADCIWENTKKTDVGTDIHWALGQAYDCLLDDFDYQIDFPIKAIANYKLEDLPAYSNNTNAYADTKGKKLFFGIGDEAKKNSLPIASIDLVGHKLFHLVIHQEGKLWYKAEPGAINEGLCDIFGKYLEYKIRKDDPKNAFSWWFGKDFFLPPEEGVRFLEDPLYDERPDVFNGANNWVEFSQCEITEVEIFDLTDDTDNCGVHSNSGPLNRWFYLLSEGGNGLNSENTSYKVQKIGLEKAGKIAIRTFLDELGYFSDYNDMFEKTIMKAEELYGSCSIEVNEVKNAWYAVGIGEPGIMISTLVTEGASCNIADGAASVFMQDLNENYAFLWDNGQNGDEATNLAAGTHQVTITKNVSGCSLVHEFKVPENLSFRFQVNPSAANDCGDPNGSANLSVSDTSFDPIPEGDLIIYWKDSGDNQISNFDGETFISGLAPDEYTVHIEQVSTGCAIDWMFPILQEEIEVGISGAKKIICSGRTPPESVRLSAFTLNCSDCVFSWKNESSQIVQEGAEFLVPLAEAELGPTYTLIAKREQFACSSEIKATIEVEYRDCTECEEEQFGYATFSGVDPCREFTIEFVRPVDPNEIIGPQGYGDPHWVAVAAELPYTILFENDPEFAMARASRVEVTHQLGAHVDPLAFRVGNFGFANLSFTVPENKTFYAQRLDVRDSLGVYVDVSAGIDVNANKAFWIFEAIDPQTGLPPADPDLGLLPVNDTLTRRGEGYVNFRIRPKSNSETGDTILARANIVFDENESILTNEVFNVIDALPPTSLVRPPAEPVDSTAFTVSWFGGDDPGGSGLKTYNLFVSENERPFSLYRSNLTDTSLIFTGAAGQTYCFYAEAVDQVGNIEENTAEAICITAGCIAPQIDSVGLTQPTCSAPTAEIIVHASSDEALDFSLDNGASWDTSSTFNSLIPGDYDLWTRLRNDTTCTTAYAGNPVIIDGDFQPDWYADADGDGYGDPNNTLKACDQPIDYTADNTDCNDADASINPATVWYADMDGDGLGDPNVSQVSCTQPSAYVLDNTDCDDSLIGPCVNDCRTTDSLALVALYNATDGANWSNVWDLNMPMDTWHGVYLNAEGCVRTLLLRYNQLNGNIPPDLGNLTNLTRLFFQGNQLSGCFPEEIRRFCDLGFSDIIFSDGYNFTDNPGLPWGGDFTRFCNNEVQIGAVCDDGNSLTTNDVITADCECLGVVNPCRMQDSLALVAFYHATNGANWTNTWDLNMSMDTWQGVGFNDEGCVRSLSLYNNQLSGIIAPELGALTNLSNLYLPNNQLNGSIPVELGNLVNLTSLNISGNQLSDTIPAELGNLANLTQLELFQNQLSGNIPPELGNLFDLNLLHLQNNQLSGCFPDELFLFCDSYVSSNFTNNPDLPWGGDFQRFCNGEDQPSDSCNDPNAIDFCEGLSISAGPHKRTGCDTCLVLLSGTGPVGPNYTYQWRAIDGSELPYGNEGLNVVVPTGNLYVLEMIDEAQGCILRDFIEVNPAIEGQFGPTFKFSSASPEVGQPFCVGIFTEDFSGMHSAQLPIHWDTELVELEQVDTVGGIGGFSWIQEDENRLDLYWEYGECPADVTLADDLLMIQLCFRWIAETVGTTVIEIGGGPATANKGFDDFCLDVGLNQIQAVIQARELSCRTRDSLALVALYNVTDGPNWTNTWDLSMPMDTWYGVTLNEEGCAICLDMDGDPDCERDFSTGGNNLMGTIPVELGFLDNLQKLFLSQNQLSGTIPSELGDLSNLTVLNLSENQLSGTIPIELGNLLNLTDLNLSSNQFDGNIPTQLGNLINLTGLRLSVNQLSGAIPPGLGNLSDLTYLALNNNQLSGTVPVELADLMNLINLTLHTNQLIGTIPVEIGNLSNLQVLWLFSNQLNGFIPPELGNLSNLISLRLYNNQLSGCFPESFQIFCNIDYDFRGNSRLPWQGDFSRFCNDEPQIGAACDDGDPNTQNDVITADCSCMGSSAILVSPTVYLQGAYDLISGLMNDELRTSFLPLNEPYASLDYTHVGGGGETAQQGVFNVSGPNAIVDWVFLELRDKSDYMNILATRSALLQRDGDVVDVDGVSPVVFANLLEDDYYVVVKHRNHLGVMSAVPITCSSVSVIVDFTNDLNAVFGEVNGAAVLSNGRLGLYSGDFNRNGQVQNTDYNEMISTLGVSGYQAGDFDLNSQVQNTDLQLKLIPNIGKGQPFGQ